MYSYQAERDKLFTEEGQRLFLAVRDDVNKKLDIAGAVMVQKVNPHMGYDGWTFLACFDRLVELGEITPVNSNKVAGQHQIFRKTEY